MKSPCLKRYYVIGPEVDEVIPILDDGSGPSEYFHDVCVVWANSKRGAKTEAVKKFRLKNAAYIKYGETNPFVGLEVELHYCQHPHENEDDDSLCPECTIKTEEELMKTQMYFGDGVYAEFDGDDIILTANGTGPNATDTIFLSQQMLALIVDWNRSGYRDYNTGRPFYDSTDEILKNQI